MEGYRRLNRSNVHLSVEEEAKVEEKTREYFDEKAHKRHTKPQRSDYSSNYVDVLADADNNNDSNIPEYFEFQCLENDFRKIVYNGSEVREEFVETDYYKDFNYVDMQHHSTGTGFIKLENANGTSFSLEPDLDINCCLAANFNFLGRDYNI